ncbi:signal transduction histidine kinase [Clostridium tetanomorphum]|uniref:histidine kinase n=1 Tax=Clostridium tetanomorphum TaxID=1553 RepID=A0A923EDQ3_CLOTT|nr:sensor histidine kinase [Clostridium tetanomorphum]KAJ49236.1 sensor histidine kinase [Clostridium tetanomorphum DSM 665]KAJ50369.1 sensor histidine kinase [Clostridium tetanomorphum DSM 665]MBC2398763.1 HAMP domain-containing histidine kinase [Clostridium tetanomorphum]MBP1865819.1 signal transduction histidine kinase [Clostridium tetanomorphum]NRS86939.1 signal transduction histidine kinase [Clostridium tetanomorphum]
MKFIDFLKDRIAYIITYFMSISLVILIMYLTIFIKVIEFPIINVLYAYLISIVIFIIFLIYEYSKVRMFYKRLYGASNSENIIEDIINIGEAKNIEQKLFINTLEKLHKSYEGKIYKYEDIQKHYSNFINQWVHQMKTPVSIINLILQEEYTAEFKEIFDSIGEENEKISQGLNIMLYNARINEFNHDFNVEDIDILLILRKVVNDNKKLLIRHKIFPEIIGKTTIVQTDKKWIYFVINQIVINAIKYTAVVKKDKKAIKFNIEEDTTKIVVSIEDNGIGIPKEDLGRVFNVFFTGKNGRKTSESTGMGMYLSKRICEGLGNKLYVESEEGKGTKFYIDFYKGKNIFKL